MIFITLGSQKFQFNRLIKAVDEQVMEGKINDRVFAQIGASDYIPKSFEYKSFLDRDQFAHIMDQADIVITHGGTGAIIGAIKKGKKVIAVPRLAEYGEHVDDHQLQLIRQFSELDLIYECLNCGKIWKAIETARDREFKPYHSNTARIIDSIDRFIDSVKRNCIDD